MLVATLFFLIIEETGHTLKEEFLSKGVGKNVGLHLGNEPYYQRVFGC